MQWFQLQLINMNQRHTFFNAHPTENMTVLSNQLSNEDFTPSNGLYDLLKMKNNVNGKKAMVKTWMARSHCHMSLSINVVGR